MNGWRAALLILWLPVVGADVAPAIAAAAEPAGRTVVARAAVSMDQAVRMVEERFHARVVKAEAQKGDGRTVYVLRLLNDSGKVWTVRVDASDGSVQ
ncbi:MAG TPA: PepSY domain-containing protein [Steroidobacteraceae bacterium]|nr:PepSY domain-containing protein [Steroidobacteraceae bacterium]